MCHGCHERHEWRVLKRAAATWAHVRATFASHDLDSPLMLSTPCAMPLALPCQIELAEATRGTQQTGARVTHRCDVLTQIGPAAGAGKLIQPSHADLIPLAARDLCKQLFDPNP